MIDPINLIKVDDLRDKNGNTLHIGELPEYEQEEYDLSNMKDFEKYINSKSASRKCILHFFHILISMMRSIIFT